MSDRGVEDVDLLVIGGGKAGKSLAMDRAKAGWKVAMVERDKIGGTCINVACIPTKALVGSARTVLMARHAEVMGVELGDQPLVSVDGLRRHKSSVVDGMVAAHKKMFADSGMDFILRCRPLHRAPYRRGRNSRRAHPVASRNRCRDQHCDDAGHPRSSWHHRVEGLDVGDDLAAGTVAAATDRFGRWIRRAHGRRLWTPTPT